MSNARQISTPLGDQELKRLETLLGDPMLANAMRLDEVQGYLCAALSGPQPLPSEAWLMEVLGSEDAANSAVGRQATDLLQRFAAALEAELARGEVPMLLLYAKDDAAGPSDYLPWCQAYLHGMDTSPEDWFAFLGYAEDEETDEEVEEEMSYLDERLFPLLLLTGEAKAAAREHGEEWPDGEEEKTLNEECEASLPQAVTDIYRFWVAKRGIKTIRHTAAKVGRNEPCPCASGKKFKLCCGLSNA